MRTRKTSTRRKIALALAGGGAHSAFTWGVLDFLLGDLKDRVEIVAISGTSGGAMNAAITGYGLGSGEPKPESAARKLLEAFWVRTSQTADLFANPYRHVPTPLWWSWNTDGTPLPTLLSMSTSALGPAQLTQLHRNPLALILESLLEFGRFAKSDSMPDLFVCATNVRTNQLKVFDRTQLSADVLCASACLPSADWPVVIGDEPYWDGGFRADPAISPLLESPRLQARSGNGAGGNDEAIDVALVGINPLIRDDLPLFAWQIMDRANEITLNSSIIDEVKRLMMMNDILESIDHLPATMRGTVKALKPLTGKRRVRLHYIESEAEMAPLGLASKNNTALLFLETLRDMGYRAANQWWDTEGGAEDIGDLKSKNWRDKIMERFINPHHWDSPTQSARRETPAQARVQTRSTATATA